MPDDSRSELIYQLQKIYNGKAWHGPNVVTSIADLSLEQTIYRVGETHNIAELVHHMYAWRLFIIKRLTGEENFEVSDDFNFVIMNEIEADHWQSLKDQLECSQRDLIVAIQHFDESRWKEKITDRDYTFLDLLHGIIHHDLYHLGQIVLLKRMSQSFE